MKTIMFKTEINIEKYQMVVFKSQQFRLNVNDFVVVIVRLVCPHINQTLLFDL